MRASLDSHCVLSVPMPMSPFCHRLRSSSAMDLLDYSLARRTNMAHSQEARLPSSIHTCPAQILLERVLSTPCELRTRIIAAFEVIRGRTMQDHSQVATNQSTTTLDSILSMWSRKIQLCTARLRIKMAASTEFDLSLFYQIFSSAVTSASQLYIIPPGQDKRPQKDR